MIRLSNLPKLPRRYAHFLFAVIQSGMTSAIASAIACFRLAADTSWISEWFTPWLAAWAIMVPIVLLAAPAIRSIANVLTSDET
jgi:Protein of unknown function (DUF2798)